MEDSTLEEPLLIFTLHLPNFSWRKKMLYIHDIEYIMNKQETFWKGVMFIDFREIPIGFLIHFPFC